MTSVMRDMRVATDAMLAANPEMMAHVDRLWPAAKAGGWANVAFQSGSGRVYPADKLAAVSLMGMCEDGSIAVLTVSVGHKPSADKKRAENQKKLDDLPHPFTAGIGQMSTLIGTADGWVEWSEEIRATSGGKSVTIKPGALALEIGYMPSGKTHGHVVTGHYGGLARWPYGSDRLVLMIPRTRPDLWPQG